MAAPLVLPCTRNPQEVPSKCQCRLEFLAGRKRVPWLLSTFHLGGQLAAPEIGALEKPHPGAARNPFPQSPWTRRASSPTFPENRRHLSAHSAWIHALNTSSRQVAHRCHRALSSSSQPRSCLGRQGTSEPRKQLCASGGPVPAHTDQAKGSGRAPGEPLTIPRASPCSTKDSWVINQVTCMS